VFALIETLTSFVWYQQFSGVVEYWRIEKPCREKGVSGMEQREGA
jgi:hypothetical protein